MAEEAGPRESSNQLSNCPLLMTVETGEGGGGRGLIWTTKPKRNMFSKNKCMANYKSTDTFCVILTYVPKLIMLMFIEMY